MNYCAVTRIVVIAGSSLALLCGGATAQDKQQDKKQQQGQQQGSQGSTAAPVAGRIPLGVTTIEADLVASGFRASKLLHKEVYNEQGQKIGKIDDFVISPDGKLSIAVVNVSEFLGLKSHRVAIPVSQFKELYPRATLPGADKTALKALPKFEYVT
jgi:sporulation protein YlmC with PRC-barrel domain